MTDAERFQLEGVSRDRDRLRAQLDGWREIANALLAVAFGHPIGSVDDRRAGRGPWADKPPLELVEAVKDREIVHVFGDVGNPVAVEPRPVVGLGCTVCHYTDRSAATVVAVSPSGHRVSVREDKATRTDKNGMSDSQQYTYEPDPEGRLWTMYRNKHGRYGKGPRLVLGVRRSYHDYSF